MEFSFENQGTNTYLVYEVKSNDTIDNLSLGMLTNNNILGLVQTQFTQMNEKKFLKYNVSAHISVRQFFEGSVNKKRLLGVFKGIVDALLSAEDYMIDANSILLDLDYMFADVSTCETVLICLPIVDATKEQVNLGVFFKNIIFSTQFDQTENCDYVAKIINYLNSAAQFSLTEFKNVLGSIDKDTNNIATLQKNQESNKKAEAKVSENVHSNNQPIPRPQAKPQTKIQSVQERQMPIKKQENNSTEKNVLDTTPKIKIPVSQSKMEIPKKKNVDAELPQLDTQTNGQKISWLYLMQHYNKENAAAYKAQKEAKKEAKKAAKEKKTTIQPPSKNSEQQMYEMPGQYEPQIVQKQQPDIQNEIQPMTNFAPVYQPDHEQFQVKREQEIDFGDTTVLFDDSFDDTTVLNATNNSVQQAMPYLIRKKNNEKIILNKAIFRIGKEKSFVDYAIIDNKTISRSHANIISREGKYFVLDTNSTNHTFVNSTMISSNEEVQINHGDIVKLSNEEFEFKCY